MIRGRIASLVVGASLCLALAVPARADQVADLTKTLTTSSSDKTRLSAVVALAKLGDKKTLKPLVAALDDPSAEVRAAAAVALGHLGHKASLPRLKDVAQNDPDDGVRSKAHTAASLVAKANHIADDQKSDKKEVAAKDEAKGPKQGGFGHSPHAVDGQPDLYVVVKTSNDDSPGKTDKDGRKNHADVLKQTLVDELKSQPTVVTTATDAQKYNLDVRQVDLSVVKLELAQVGGYMEVDAELRLAISDDKGRMQSFVSGGAKVSVPKAKYDSKHLPELQREAIENAMRGMFDKLLAHLRKTSQS